MTVIEDNDKESFDSSLGLACIYPVNKFCLRFPCALQGERDEELKGT